MFNNNREIIIARTCSIPSTVSFQEKLVGKREKRARVINRRRIGIKNECYNHRVACSAVKEKKEKKKKQERN